MPGALWKLVGALGGPASLADLGLPADGVPEVVRQILAVPYANPRPVVAEEIAALLHRALAGAPPPLT